MTADFALHELCVVACAEAWRGDGEILASPIGALPSVAARLARATFAPELLLTDGVASLLSASGAVEGWMPYRSIFDLVWSGRRHVMMGASQIDRFGNQNISCVGPHDRPKAQLVGMRGAPGNTISHPTSYWIPAHSPRVFVPRVDVVCGVGYDRAAALGDGTSPATGGSADVLTARRPSPERGRNLRPGRFHEIRRVVTNLGVFDFQTPDHSMRLVSRHPGVTVEEIVRATGFALLGLDTATTTREPSAEELRLLRDVIDPNATAGKELVTR